MKLHTTLTTLCVLATAVCTAACGDDDAETTTSTSSVGGSPTTTTVGGSGGEPTGTGGSGMGGGGMGGGGMGGGGMGGTGGMNANSVESGAIVWGDYQVEDVVDMAHATFASGSLEMNSLPVSGLAGAHQILDVAVSPDGSQIAVAGRATSTSSAVINVYAGHGTGAPVTVADASNGANTDAVFSNLAWSPDGSMISFISDREVAARDRGYVVAADGASAPKLVTQNPDSDNIVRYLIWADATHVAFVGSLATTRECIHAVDVTETTITPVELAPCSTFASNEEVFQAVPPGIDGAGNVYFMADHELGNLNYRLYRNSAASPTSATQVPGTALLDGSSNERALSTFGMSPTGDRVAIAVGDVAGIATAFNVHVVDLTTQAVTQVTSGSAAPYQGVADTAQAIRWSPDGTKLAFRAHYGSYFQFEIYVVPADGSSAEVEVFDGNFSNVFFSPDSSRIFAVDADRVLSTADFATAAQNHNAAALVMFPAGALNGLAPVP